MNQLYALFGLPGGSEWIIILIVILLLFGGTKIPQLMRGVGKGVGELQKGLQEGKRNLEQGMREIEEEDARKQAEKSHHEPSRDSA